MSFCEGLMKDGSSSCAFCLKEIKFGDIVTMFIANKGLLKVGCSDCTVKYLKLNE